MFVYISNVDCFSVFMFLDVFSARVVVFPLCVDLLLCFIEMAENITTTVRCPIVGCAIISSSQSDMVRHVLAAP